MTVQWQEMEPVQGLGERQACFFPPAYVCVGRRARIHKQSARGFVCSRQGLQAVPRASGPNCVSKEAGVADAAGSAIVAFTGEEPTHSLVLLRTHTLLQICRPAWHPKTSAFGRSGLEPLSCQRSTAGRGPPGAVSGVLSLLGSGCWVWKHVRHKMHLGESWQGQLPGA